MATASAHDLFAHGVGNEPLRRWTVACEEPHHRESQQESRSHGQSQRDDENLRSARPVRECVEATDTVPQSHCSSTRVLQKLRGPPRKACCKWLGRVCNPTLERQRCKGWAFCISHQISHQAAAGVLARSARLSHAFDTAGTS